MHLIMSCGTSCEWSSDPLQGGDEGKERERTGIPEDVIPLFSDGSQVEKSQGWRNQ